MKVIMFSFFIVLINACSTLTGVSNSKDSGIKKEYSVSPKEAKEITKKILDSLKVEVSEKYSNDNNTFVGKSWNSIWHWGTLIGVWLDKVNESATMVTVKIMRSYKLQMKVDITEEEFHNTFSKEASKN